MLSGHHFQRQVSARGFSLVELMISVAIGMIVAAGAVSLIVAIDRSNSEMIQSTRLNQELRALASVIAGEIKRSRRVHDPIAAVGQGASLHSAFDFINTSTAGCIVYGYQDKPLSSGTVTSEYVNYYQAIYLTGSGNIGSVKFSQLQQTKTQMDAAKAASGTPSTFDGTSLALGCTDSANSGKGATTTTVTSPQLDVDALAFQCITTTGSSVTLTSANSASCNEIDVTITAKLRYGDYYMKNQAPARTYVQQVFIRSGAVKTS